MWPFTKYTTLADSGVIGRLTDLHSHILPAVDDGASSTNESLSMLGVLNSLGVKRLWITPHVMEDMPNSTENLRKSFTEFKADAEVYGKDMMLNLGAENMLDSLFLNRLDSDDLLTVLDDRHLLVETSYYSAPMEFDRILNKIKDRGFIPVLAHPERYRYMNHSGYRNLKERGVAFQLNYVSLAGAYGEEAYRKAIKMLDERMYDFAGSDIHNVSDYEIAVNTPIKASIIERLIKII